MISNHSSVRAMSSFWNSKLSEWRGTAKKVDVRMKWWKWQCLHVSPSGQLVSGQCSSLCDGWISDSNPRWETDVEATFLNSSVSEAERPAEHSRFIKSISSRTRDLFMTANYNNFLGTATRRVKYVNFRQCKWVYLKRSLRDGHKNPCLINFSQFCGLRLVLSHLNKKINHK